MNEKRILTTFILILIGLITFIFVKNFAIKNNINSSLKIPQLSLDKKDIVVNDEDLLSVDNNIIFNWFKKESQLCDEYNINSNPDRKKFCEDKEFFRSITRFDSINVSPDGMEIGFSIESDTLSPDKVVGIYSIAESNLKILTNYYLGNEFISFSPDGKNFVYKSYCFENNCGFTIKDSNTLIDKISFGNNPDDSDYSFVRWNSDNNIEYKYGGELIEVSF